MVYAGAGVLMLTTVIFIWRWIADGAQTWTFYPQTELIDHLMTVGDIVLMCLIIYLSVKYKKILPILLTVSQTALLLYTEFTAEVVEGPHMMVDWLTILMCIIIAFIGGFICIYTVGYMKGYHAHHTDVQDGSHSSFLCCSCSSRPCSALSCRRILSGSTSSGRSRA